MSQPNQPPEISFESNEESRTTDSPDGAASRQLDPAANIPGLLQSAIAHHQAGRLNEAERIYQLILSTDPNHTDSLHLLGLIAKQNGHLPVALELIRLAISIDANEALYHSNLGTIFEAQGKPEEAAACYQRALELKPNYAEAHHNLAGTLVAQGKLAEAITHYERAIDLNPQHADLHNNLGFALMTQSRFAEAIAHFERAIALRPNFAEAYNNLGNALLDEGKPQAATSCHARALSLKAGYVQALNNLGNALRAQGSASQALLCYDGALSSNPYFAEAAYGKALVHLWQGDFSAGWQHYERRWQTVDQKALRMFPQPMWNGKKLPSGSVLLWGEQGVGDEIMFAGLAPDVLRSGNKCVLDCDARLKPLFARSFPETEVISGYKLAEHADLDIGAQLPSGSLPGLFRTTYESFAATTSPYLVPDPEKREALRMRYHDGRRVVGLAWHTTNKKTGRVRSIDLSAFAPLFARNDIRWVSLQYGDHGKLESEASAAGASILIDRSIDQLQNIDAFAAQIAALDMVITIDNATAHLAGALGVPVWVLLPFASDWRWLQEREDSPWYPTMRLFRQTSLGDWQSVIERVQKAL